MRLGLGLLLLGHLGFEGLLLVRGEVRFPSQTLGKVPGLRQLADRDAAEGQKASATSAEEAEDSVKAEAEEPVEEGRPAVDASDLLEKVHDLQELADRVAAQSQKVADANTADEAKEFLEDAKAEAGASSEEAEDPQRKAMAEVVTRRLAEGTASQKEIPEMAVTKMPWNAICPCATMVLLIYIYLAVDILPTALTDYERLKEQDEEEQEEEEEELPRRVQRREVDRRDPALVLAAVLYWVVMPIALVSLGFGATCEEGPPNLAYITYGVFFAVHFVCIFRAMLGSLRKDLHDSTPKLIFMLGLAALEHFDMASDALFTGTSAACSDEITSLWLQSWHDGPGGGLMVPMLSKLGFSGVALFITNAYLPQLLSVFAPFAPFGALVFVLLVLLWAAFGWLVGLAAMLSVYVFLICSPLGEWQMFVFHQQVDSDLHLALYVGAEVVELRQDAVLTERRVLLILGTKLVLENLLQLWLQSSYLSLSFDRMDTFARCQAMASIGVGLLVAGYKGIQISAVVVAAIARLGGSVVRECDITGLILGAVAVFMMLGGFGGLAWVAAKVVFIFQCDSHVWNLSTGCVSPQT
ncbi:hypothetical protein AK812_SmicGene24363 [Symbiodinium microadriaticum]|uniref:Uncharacterized protein n=1 Tax=Symbiodinium microadriaticum TaxID=2951 RepID=A0A1Q9DES9_SYMMI|nr:hypothetical protein AK812_SmicGene24363 [Symbiodinium microadriaticum]